MANDLKNFQRGGLYTIPSGNVALLSNAAKADTEIVRALNIPSVLRLGSNLSNTGIGRHKTRLAVDYQGGKPNNILHQAIVDYVLDPKNWIRLNLRYVAFNGWEYIAPRKGAMWSKRVQPWYGGDDPWHKNHVHVDWWDNTPNGANPNISLGSAFQNVVPGVSTYVQKMLDDLEYDSVRDAQEDLGLVQDGHAGSVTTKALEKEMSKLDTVIGILNKQSEEIEKIKQSAGKTWRVVGAVADTNPNGTLTDPEVERARSLFTDLRENAGHARKRSDQNNKVLGAIDPDNPKNANLWK